MILDWHSHIYTPEEAADDLRTWDGHTGPSWGERGCPMVLENFLRAHEENHIDISVVSNAAHYLKGKRDGKAELASVQSKQVETQARASFSVWVTSSGPCSAACKISGRGRSTDRASARSAACSGIEAVRSARVSVTRSRGSSSSVAAASCPRSRPRRCSHRGASRSSD